MDWQDLEDQVKTAPLSGAGLAAALSELVSMQQYPPYLEGVIGETGLPPYQAALQWAIRRGQLWS